MESLQYYKREGMDQMKSQYTGSTSEVLWFNHTSGVFKTQPRDTGITSEEILTDYEAEKYHQQGGE